VPLSVFRGWAVGRWVWTEGVTQLMVVHVSNRSWGGTGCSSSKHSDIRSRH
jgi:hypothetical protein